MGRSRWKMAPLQLVWLIFLIDRHCNIYVFVVWWLHNFYRWSRSKEGSSLWDNDRCSVGAETWCDAICKSGQRLRNLFPPIMLRVVTSFLTPSVALAGLPSCLFSHTRSQMWLPVAHKASLGDKWSWVFTIAIISWRGRGAVCLYSANLITALSLFFVNTQCNLKATPGPRGNAKQTTCQSTGAPPEMN